MPRSLARIRSSGVEGNSAWAQGEPQFRDHQWAGHLQGSHGGWGSATEKTSINTVSQMGATQLAWSGISRTLASLVSWVRGSEEEKASDWSPHKISFAQSRHDLQEDSGGDFRSQAALPSGTPLLPKEEKPFLPEGQRRGEKGMKMGWATWQMSLTTGRSPRARAFAVHTAVYPDSIPTNPYIFPKNNQEWTPKSSWVWQNKKKKRIPLKGRRY